MARGSRQQKELGQKQRDLACGGLGWKVGLRMVGGGASASNFLMTVMVQAGQSDRAYATGQTGHMLPVTQYLGRVFAVMDRESAWG
uniref:Uncharacterized protein n=2 Tax=Oryza sativa subsp. japonica TaxID=39947 RepID=Q2R730_ORYSJ|nr:hypothetical protein LOC_Os11g18000 [Oryza sativa Japonica Group]ABA92704.1 hypothetical protein LOC_Os11g18000 [Oryza sativa Japonica Group]